MDNKKKLIEVPAYMRLEVPANMSKADIQALVTLLTYGDFAVYPDDASGSLTAETIDHLNVNATEHEKEIIKKITCVDLWANENKYEINDL